MTNRAKQRGTAFETRLVKYLRENGWPNAERRALSGSADKGDVSGMPVVLEAKAQKSFDLAGWIDEAKAEAKNAGVPMGIVVFPRRNHSMDEAYALLRLGDLMELLK